MTGTIRHSSTRPRITLSRKGGAKVRSSSDPCGGRRSRTGGLPSQLDPAFDFCGAAESTATRPCFGTRRPGAVMPLLPRKARLPILAGAMCTQPWASS